MCSEPRWRLVVRVHPRETIHWAHRLPAPPKAARRSDSLPATRGAFPNPSPVLVRVPECAKHSEELIGDEQLRLIGGPKPGGLRRAVLAPQNKNPDLTLPRPAAGLAHS